MGEQKEANNQQETGAGTVFPSIVTLSHLSTLLLFSPISAAASFGGLILILQMRTLNVESLKCPLRSYRVHITAQ